MLSPAPVPGGGGARRPEALSAAMASLPTCPGAQCWCCVFDFSFVERSTQPSILSNHKGPQEERVEGPPEALLFHHTHTPREGAPKGSPPRRRPRVTVLTHVRTLGSFRNSHGQHFRNLQHSAEA